jgi:hypothetical protein
VREAVPLQLPKELSAPDDADEQQA